MKQEEKNEVLEDADIALLKEVVAEDAMLSEVGTDADAELSDVDMDVSLDVLMGEVVDNLEECPICQTAMMELHGGHRVCPKCSAPPRIIRNNEDRVAFLMMITFLLNQVAKDTSRDMPKVTVSQIIFGGMPKHMMKLDIAYEMKRIETRESSLSSRERRLLTLTLDTIRMFKAVSALKAMPSKEIEKFDEVVEETKEVKKPTVKKTTTKKPAAKKKTVAKKTPVKKKAPAKKKTTTKAKTTEK